MTGLPTRFSVRFTVATSSTNESSPYWTAITSCPSACNAGMTLLKHEPSAQMPWQNTMVGLEALDIYVLLLRLTGWIRGCFRCCKHGSEGENRAFSIGD